MQGSDRSNACPKARWIERECADKRVLQYIADDRPCLCHHSICGNAKAKLGNPNRLLTSELNTFIAFTCLPKLFSSYLLREGSDIFQGWRPLH